MPLLACVRMYADDYRRLIAGGTFRASDPRRAEVSAFLRAQGLPDPEPFTSLVIVEAEAVPTRSAWLNYATVTGVLKLEKLLPELVLVAADDIQDAAINRRPERLRAVSGSAEERTATLLWAARSSGRSYAEARLSRELRRDDFWRFDTSGDLELSLDSTLESAVNAVPAVQALRAETGVSGVRAAAPEPATAVPTDDLDKTLESKT